MLQQLIAEKDEAFEVQAYPEKVYEHCLGYRKKDQMKIMLFKCSTALFI